LTKRIFNDLILQKSIANRFSSSNFNSGKENKKIVETVADIVMENAEMRSETENSNNKEN
jgi:hypothetical protein